MATSDPNALETGDHTFQAGQISFAYTVAGNGPLLVAQAPGWGPGSAYMINGWKQFTEHFTVVYFNARGNPPSSRPVPESDMSTDAMANDLETLRIHLNVPSFMLIGHSNGGSISLGYAENFPERVSKLVLVDHGLKGFKDPTGTWDRLAEARKDHPIYGPALKTFQAVLSGSVNIGSDEEFGKTLAEMIPYYMADPTTGKIFIDSMDPLMHPSIWAFKSQAQADAASTANRVELLQNVKAKTLIVWGKEDPICPLSYGERTLEGIEGARLVVYEDCGHMAWIEKKDKFFEDVIKFLQS